LDRNIKEWACSLSGCDGGNIEGDIWLCGIEWGGASGSDYYEKQVMRDYYQAFNISPTRKLLRRELRRRTQSDAFDDATLHDLFPGDVLVQGSKIAGVPIPMLDAELEHKTYQTKAAPTVAHFIDSTFF